ncbi:MAG: hypothetical protein M3460_14540 [Actinomycetota bacterium]|nr:hypothetical protein [Actinomycetota bacterium]
MDAVHGQATQKDDRRLSQLLRHHPLGPAAHHHAVSHWRARYGETRTPGSEGGRTEKDLHLQEPRRAADPAYTWGAWDAAAATGAALLWRAPTQLDLPVLRVLDDGTYLTVLIKPTIRGSRRERILSALAAGADPTGLADAVDEKGRPVAHPARVIEYEVPDRDGNGTGELIVLLTTILNPSGDNGARADELAAAYHQRWEQETAHGQLKTHLRGPGRVLRSKLPDLAYQEIWAYLIVHHAISALTAQASAAADLDPTGSPSPGPCA